MVEILLVEGNQKIFEMVNEILKVAFDRMDAIIGRKNTETQFKIKNCSIQVRSERLRSSTVTWDIFVPMELSERMDLPNL